MTDASAPVIPVVEEVKKDVAVAEAIISTAAASTPAKVPTESPEIVAAVQAKLKDLNYSGVGPVDTDMGSKTQDSILAFRRQEGLPLKAHIDGELLQRLEVAGPKEIPERQANATTKEVAQSVGAVNKTGWAKFWAKVTAIPSLIVSLVLGVMDHLDEASTMLAPLKGMAAEVPGYVWIGGAGVTALLIYWQAANAEKALVEGYQRGTVKDD